MRILALSALAFVASACTIHVVEQPATPIAAEPPPASVEAPRPVIAQVPGAATPLPAAQQAPAAAQPSAQLPTTPVRSRPRPELTNHAQLGSAPAPSTPAPSAPDSKWRLRFKDTKPQPRTTTLTNVATEAKVRRPQKVEPPSTRRTSLAGVAKAE
jgi:hypothetical protein